MFSSLFVKVVLGTVGAAVCVGVGYVVGRAVARRQGETTLPAQAKEDLLKDMSSLLEKVNELKAKAQEKVKTCQHTGEMGEPAHIHDECCVEK